MKRVLPLSVGPACGVLTYRRIQQPDRHSLFPPHILVENGRLVSLLHIRLCLYPASTYIASAQCSSFKPFSCSAPYRLIPITSGSQHDHGANSNQLQSFLTARRRGYFIKATGFGQGQAACWGGPMAHVYDSRTWDPRAPSERWPQRYSRN